MARVIVRKDDPWSGNEGPDIRGWEVQTRDGRVHGLVEDVYVDPGTRRVEAVSLASGREIAAGEMELGDGVIYMASEVSELHSPAPQGAQREEPAPSDDPDSFDAHYREHFQRAYGKSGRDFRALLGAYRFGREKALEPKFYGRPYVRADEELQALFELSHPGTRFPAVREAVRYGYESGGQIAPTRNLDQLREGGMPVEFNWDRDQIRPVREGMHVEQAGRTASDMAMGTTPAGAGGRSMEEQQRANRKGA